MTRYEGDVVVSSLKSLMPLNNMPPITIELATVDGRAVVVSQHNQKQTRLTSS